MLFRGGHSKYNRYIKYIQRFNESWWWNWGYK